MLRLTIVCVAGKPLDANWRKRDLVDHCAPSGEKEGPGAKSRPGALFFTAAGFRHGPDAAGLAPSKQGASKERHKCRTFSHCMLTKIYKTRRSQQRLCKDFLLTAFDGGAEMALATDRLRGCALG